METAAGDVNHDRQNDQKCPDHHDVLDVESGRIHPAPDERIEGANQSQDSLERPFILEKLNQHNDKADDATQPQYQSENSIRCREVAGKIAVPATNRSAITKTGANA